MKQRKRNVLFNGSSLLASALGVMTLGLAGLGLRKKKEEN
ncbi:LPXTG cell wall anchor domain-containing protein [Streptococcus agalactiae]